jgi:hypothetical protein
MPMLGRLHMPLTASRATSTEPVRFHFLRSVAGPQRGAMRALLCVLNQGARHRCRDTLAGELLLWPIHNRCVALGWLSSCEEASLRFCSGDVTGGQQCQIQVLDHQRTEPPPPVGDRPRPVGPPPVLPPAPACLPMARRAPAYPRAAPGALAPPRAERPDPESRPAGPRTVPHVPLLARAPRVPALARPAPAPLGSVLAAADRALVAAAHSGPAAATVADPTEDATATVAARTMRPRRRAVSQPRPRRLDPSLSRTR